MAPTDYYVTPTGNETAGFYEIFGFVGRSATAGLFWPIMLLVVWVVSFMGLKQYSTSRAWTFASFFCAVLSILLAVLDYISPKFMYLPIMLTLIGFVWLKLEAE
jgi:prepilin signal peptidase PulO-like enzyme (type II secretory pathway)